jgi:hypothetical protein
MDKHSLPLYAIIELLIRITGYDDRIGDYKNHVFDQHYVTVTTTMGSIIISNEQIAKQFLKPAEITTEELLITASTFNAIY